MTQYCREIALTFERISSEKEGLVSIEPVEKEERTQTLVPIKDIKE